MRRDQTSPLGTVSYRLMGDDGTCPALGTNSDTAAYHEIAQGHARSRLITNPALLLLWLSHPLHCGCTQICCGSKKVALGITSARVSLSCAFGYL